MTLSPEEREHGRLFRQAKARERKAERQSRPARVQPSAEGQRRPRKREPGYLAFLRRQPCSVRLEPHGLGCSGPIDAAHIRSHKPGELPTGAGRKPDDQRAVSLCRAHHEQQHSVNEIRFWARYGKNPFEVAERQYQEYKGNDNG